MSRAVATSQKAQVEDQFDRKRRRITTGIEREESLDLRATQTHCPRAVEIASKDERAEATNIAL